MDAVPSPSQQPGSRFTDLPTPSTTLWGLFLTGSADSAKNARKLLVLRYRKAIRRYLGALLRDDDRADDVTQDVILRILEGAFDGWDAARGGFRAYLKRAVHNAALDVLRKQAPAPLPPDETLGLPDPDTDLDARWLDLWRKSVLDGAMQELDAYQRQHDGNVFATLARLLIDHPDASSDELADLLGRSTRRDHNAVAVRQRVRCLRLKFAELLVEQVRQTLPRFLPEEVEQELIETGLMGYVRRFLPPDWRARGELAAAE